MLSIISYWFNKCIEVASQQLHIVYYGTLSYYLMQHTFAVEACMVKAYNIRIELYALISGGYLNFSHLWHWSHTTGQVTWRPWLIHLKIHAFIQKTLSLPPSSINWQPESWQTIVYKVPYSFDRMLLDSTLLRIKKQIKPSQISIYVMNIVRVLIWINDEQTNKETFQGHRRKKTRF